MPALGPHPAQGTKAGGSGCTPGSGRNQAGALSTGEEPPKVQSIRELQGTYRAPVGLSPPVGLNHLWKRPAPGRTKAPASGQCPSCQDASRGQADLGLDKRQEAAPTVALVTFHRNVLLPQSHAARTRTEVQTAMLWRFQWPRALGPLAEVTITEDPTLTQKSHRTDSLLHQPHTYPVAYPCRPNNHPTSHSRMHGHPVW